MWPRGGSRGQCECARTGLGIPEDCCKRSLRATHGQTPWIERARLPNEPGRRLHFGNKALRCGERGVSATLSKWARGGRCPNARQLVFEPRLRCDVRQRRMCGNLRCDRVENEKKERVSSAGHQVAARESV